jgi:hypothetical protein
MLFVWSSTFAVAGREDILSSSKTPSGSFAGPDNTDARYSTFNNVAGNQHITYMNYASPSERILATLKPVERGGYYVSQCMKGTREDIFTNIDQWLGDFDAPNVLWLSGSPGAGKSTIASSLVSRLTRRRRLGSSFFFKRGDITLSDPAALWRTVAFDLAKSNPTFAHILVRILEQRVVDPRRPDIASHFQYLIQEPLIKSHNHFPSHTIPVILVDALDECDSDRSQAAQRKVLLDTLTQWSCLPRTLKLIVTGRDDRVPESFRAICKQITLPTGGDVSADANSDIRHFFERRFSELGGSSFPEWPGVQILDALTTRAAGLFIWAETVMKFVEQGFPGERLKLVLAGELGGSDNLTKLYRQILEVSFHGIRGPELEISRFVIAVIVLAKVPLHYDDLHDFVSQPKLSVKFVINKLSSVISSRGTDKGLRICHLSFSEFLCDHERCPEQFFIDRGKESQSLALACFRLMKHGLKFNICNLETSHVFNDNVKDLPLRIKTNIPAPLLYSCSFWAAHLRDTTIGRDACGTLMTEVKDFLHIRFLYWLEVMSLTKQVSAANIALLTAAPWIEVSSYLILVSLSCFVD